FKAYGPNWWLIATVIFFSLIGVVLWGSLSGSMLPFILKKCGLDPAASSAPFVATLVDVTGIVIYFHVAFWVLSGSLLAPPPKGIVELNHKATPEVVARLLNLDERWEVEKFNLNTNRGTIEIGVVETDEFVKGMKCKDCNAGLEVFDHAPVQTWSYPDIMG